MNLASELTVATIYVTDQDGDPGLICLHLNSLIHQATCQQQTRTADTYSVEVRNIADDILVCGVTCEEHDKAWIDFTYTR